jgi:predicted HicB family RNase H-like nuclease
MSTMTYKNYLARIEFDERDNIFVGRVLGLRCIISFHGETVSELRHEFEVAIDDFLEDCKVAAQAAGKSLNQWASEVLQSAANAVA